MRSRDDYLPFGEQIGTVGAGRCGATGYSSSTDIRQKLTSKERDVESTLDYFRARYCSSAQGRFESADIILADQREQNPQSWNLYTYTRNNPTNYTDPDGKSTHTDRDGKVVAVYDDGDLGVYRHALI